jgi:hypothetical protein
MENIVLDIDTLKILGGLVGAGLGALWGIKRGLGLLAR